MHDACFNGKDEVVQALLDYGVQVDVQEQVSNISYIHVNLCNTTEVNEATLVTQEINKIVVYIYIVIVLL